MNLRDFNRGEVEELFVKSREHPRKRAIKVFHEDSYSGPHIGINVIQPDSYMRPHFRYGDESIIFNTGSFYNLQFNEEGGIINKFILSRTKENYLFVPAKTYQTFVALEPDSSFWFIAQGPHNPNGFSEPLPGTPEEKSLEARDYFERLKRTANRLFNKD